MRRLELLTALGLALLATPAAHAQSKTATTAAPFSVEADMPGGLLDPVLAESMDGPTLSIYGFADFSVSTWKVFDRGPVAAFIPQRTNFFIGNLNTYVRSDFDDFTFMMEVRFLYQPHGSTDRFSGDYVSATATDHADIYRRLNWGGIEIERAWLEYEMFPWLVLRVGQWLTPYGIWNVDHGSPAVIGVYRPYTIGEQLIPERQSGFQIRGAVPVGDLDIGYALTLSNGRGPFDSYFDLDNNKAIGGRLSLAWTASLSGVLGASVYFGRFTDATAGVQPDPDVIFISEPSIRTQYDELAWSFDLRLRLSGILLQAEVIANQRWFTTAGRAPIPFSSGELYPDELYWGGYLLLAYDTGWFGVRPYVIVERAGQATNVLKIDYSTSFTAGLNIRAHTRVTIKVQGALNIFTGARGASGQRVAGFDSQVAWAF